MSERKYLPSYERAQTPPNMQMTTRDTDILRAVFEYRLLSSEHIEALFFASDTPRGRKTSCQRRLQLLFHHGFLSRLQQPIVLGQGRSPFVYALDKLGSEYLTQTQGIDASLVYKAPQEGKSALFVEHLLAINSIRVAFSRLAAVSEWEVADWIPDFVFRTQEYAEKVPFTARGNRVERRFPDGYFVVREKDGNRKAHFFLEVDQGTMSTARWQEKIRAYSEFRSLGHSLRHFGSRNVRLLTVTASARRLESLRSATQKAGGDHFFWFTTHDQIDFFAPESVLTAQWAVATRDERQTLLGAG